MLINSNLTPSLTRPIRPASGLKGQDFPIMRQAAPADLLTAIESNFRPRFAVVHFCESGFCGERTRRLDHLLVRSEQSASPVIHPQSLSLDDEMRAPWCGQIQLNLARSTEPNLDAFGHFPHREPDASVAAIDVLRLGQATMFAKHVTIQEPTLDEHGGRS